MDSPEDAAISATDNALVKIHHRFPPGAVQAVIDFETGNLPNDVCKRRFGVLATGGCLGTVLCQML